MDHYEERLQCLLYQKKFRERLSECEPKVKAITDAAKELQNSKRLKKLLEVKESHSQNIFFCVKN